MTFNYLRKRDNRAKSVESRGAAMDWLTIFANLASIATAGVAVYGYGYYRYTLRRRRLAVEALLRTKNARHDDSLTVEQIAAHLKMTVQQVIEAAAESDAIQGWGGSTGHERRLKIGKPGS